MTINPYLAATLAIAVFAIGVVVGGKVAIRRLARMHRRDVSDDPENDDSDENFEWRKRAVHTDPEITD